jgi:hypothetical protein
MTIVCKLQQYYMFKLILKIFTNTTQALDTFTTSRSHRRTWLYQILIIILKCN